MTKKYYIGCTDYFGYNKRPDELLNNELLPLLAKLKISEKNVDKIVKIVTNIAEEAWENGADNRECEMNDY